MGDWAVTYGRAAKVAAESAMYFILMSTRLGVANEVDKDPTSRWSRFYMSCGLLASICSRIFYGQGNHESHPIFYPRGHWVIEEGEIGRIAKQ